MNIETQIGVTEKKKTLKPKEPDENAVTQIDGFDMKLYQTFGIINNLITKNIEFYKDNKVIYISGCNLVIYDLTHKKSEFIIRQCPEYTITSMSVTNKNSNEGFVCIGEYQSVKNKSQISVICLHEPTTQYILSNKDTRGQEWIIFVTKIMKNNYYCIALSKKDPDRNGSNTRNSNNLLNSQNINSSINLSSTANNTPQTKFSFWKFSQRLFIGDTILEEDIYDCAYNPNNSNELILCGKGYMRLWNVFINTGTLKEHPQKYLKTKQEKEHTFTKVEFFQDRSFMFAVGTLENVIFIIEGFNVLCEVICGYQKDSIIDLNIPGPSNIIDEEEDDEKSYYGKNKHNRSGEYSGIKNLKSKENMINVINNSNLSLSTAQKNVTGVFDEKTSQTNLNSSIKNSYEKIDENSYSINNTNNQSILRKGTTKKNNFGDISNCRSTNFDNIKIERLTNMGSFEGGGVNTNATSHYFRGNVLRTFNIINHNTLLITFQNDSYSYIYRIDKDIKRKKEELNSLINSLPVMEHKFTLDEIAHSHEIEEIYVMRLSKNIKRIINVSPNEDSSKFIYMVEVYNKVSLNKNNVDTSICLYLLNRKHLKLSFEREIFNNFMNKFPILDFALCEKNKMFYEINSDKSLRCIDYNSNTFVMKNNLKEKPLFITCCPNNNLVGISFAHKFSLYFQLRDKILLFSEFEVSSSFAKFSDKGDYVAIFGENNISKINNIFFVDTFYLNTVHIIENFKYKVKKLCWMDNDKYIFALFENNNIFGWSVNLDFLTINLQNRLKDREANIEATYFKMIFKHFVKGNEYQDFEYDHKNDLIILTHKNIDRISVYGKSGKKLITIFDKQTIPRTMRIVQELRCLIFGMHTGSISILKWPLSDKNESTTIRKNELFEINLHTGPVIEILVTNSLKHLITASTDGSIYYSEIKIVSNNTVKSFNVLGDFDKYKPKIEIFMGMNEIYQYKISEIRGKDSKALALKKQKKLIEKNNKELSESKMEEHAKEICMLEQQKNDACQEEQKKGEHIKIDASELKTNVENELEIRREEHEKEKSNNSVKYLNKLNLYKSEIERAKREVKELEASINDKFNSLGLQQNENFNFIFNGYWDQFGNLRNDIDKAIKKLVYTNASCEEAYDSAKNEYNRIIYKLNSEMIEDIDAAKKLITEKDKELKKIIVEEKTFKNLLDKKVMESDNVIKKNVNIKQNLIDTTQRTITLQEQLLETEKNLVKIDKKMCDLNNKNKHLEQIRFVLEHRMMALEKEKAPLEGQVYYLEKQKFNLQEEFNELILEINNKNQALENKQSQLKACLIQNFEVNDHISYLKKKLLHLQKEIKFFIIRYQDNDKRKKILSIQENKATTVALQLRKFYDNYFETNIDEELLNFKYYNAKLQEETQKINISNNMDLILRDKGEEKLLSEKDKKVQIIVQKEKGFKRMQEENTILISECNRLRKNLHEVYMHVVGIEIKFEDLTKINPMLNKTEIVNQIKAFIKETHIKIKKQIDEENRALQAERENTKDDSQSVNIYNNALFRSNEDNENVSKVYEGNLLKSANDEGISNLSLKNTELKIMKSNINKEESEMESPEEEEDDKNEYEKFPCFA